MEEKDRYGDKLRDVAKAREDQWAAERDRELLVKLHSQADERAVAEPNEERMPKVFRRILSPIDFEEGSLAALDLAKRLAAENDAELDLLHVRSTFAVPARRGVASEVESEQSARKKLEEIATGLPANIRHRLLVMTGGTAEMVIDVRSSLIVDLIVMSTHGRRGVPRFFLGSVAGRVVREAACPVLTTRMAPEPPSSTTRNAFDRILCPIDFEESSFKALDLAGRIAAQTGAALYLLHVCPTLMIPLSGPTTEQVMEEQSAKQKLKEIAGLHLRDVRYELLISTGDAAESVTSLQAGLDVDLIVMGTHGRRAGTRFFLGSVAERVVREAACPVLTTRQDKTYLDEIA
jgi:nucleotide-binding universal stress UspA family protein